MKQYGGCFGQRTLKLEPSGKKLQEEDRGDSWMMKEEDMRVVGVVEEDGGG